MPQNAFFSPTNSRSSGQPKIDAKTLFFPTLHPLSPVIFATATVVALVLLRNSVFSFHCYTQREATPTQKSARKRRCDLSRLLARKITKGIHSCKPASPNRPIGSIHQQATIPHKRVCWPEKGRQDTRCLSHRAQLQATLKGTRNEDLH